MRAQWKKLQEDCSSELKAKWKWLSALFGSPSKPEKQMMPQKAEIDGDWKKQKRFSQSVLQKL